MKPQDNGEENSTRSPFGFKQVLLGDPPSVAVVVGSPDDWDSEHIDRLNQISTTAGITPLLDVDFTNDKQPYAAYPLLEYPTFADVLADKEKTWQDKIAVLAVASQALDSAHEIGLVHGALSPERILVNGDEVLIDSLGLSKGGTPPSETEPYLAPEVVEGTAPKASADLFAIGKMIDDSFDKDDKKPRSLSRLSKWAVSEVPETRPPSAEEMASVMTDSLGDYSSSYRPGYVPTTDYVSVMENIDKDVPTKADKASDDALEFEEVHADESRRVGSAEIADTEDIFVTDEDERRSFGLLGVAAIAALTALLAFWALRDNDDDIASGDEETTEEVAAPTAEEEETPDIAPEDEDETDETDEEDEPETTPTTEVEEEEESGTSETDSPVQLTTESEGLQIVNALSSDSIDLYIDGELAVADFSAGTLAGPADNGTDTYTLSAFEAVSDPAQSEADRDDSELASETVSFSASPQLASISDTDAGVEISSVTLDTSQVAAGESRIAIFNFTDSEAEATINESPLSVDSGDSTTIDIADSSAEIDLSVAGETETVGLNQTEGQLTSLYVFSDEDGGIQVSELRVTGIETAPAAVPTGDSGLAATMQTSLQLATMLALLAFGVALLRGRRAKTT